MKKYAITFGALLLVGAMGAVASAQTGYAEGKFERGYLDLHPEVAQQLSRNPGLVDNPEFMANHREARRVLSQSSGSPACRAKGIIPKRS